MPRLPGLPIDLLAVLENDDGALPLDAKIRQHALFRVEVDIELLHAFEIGRRQESGDSRFLNLASSAPGSRDVDDHWFTRFAGGSVSIAFGPTIAKGDNGA